MFIGLWVTDLLFLWLFWSIGKLKQQRIDSLSPINLALIPTDVNPIGFVPDLSMRGVGDNSIGRDNVHSLTTTFPRMHLSNRYTTSYGCRDLVERDTRPLGHPFLQAIEEQARTSITSN